MKLPVPCGFSAWWDRAPLRRETLDLALEWRGLESPLQVGRLAPLVGALRLGLQPADFTGTMGAERTSRWVAKALTRAGWLRPALDPRALLRLIGLRATPMRVEFILDTNAMAEGVGHWLLDCFADWCDLVVTAVSLRELQDNHGRAEFGKEPQQDIRKRAKMLGARQLYLAAHRLREQDQYPRVLPRELESDDTALLLSRGDPDKKSSESDTLLLRAVRRQIHNRVRNMERFFVTGDTALARRAATELPSGSVIAAQVRPISQGDVLFPLAWWPGSDQGYRVSRHPSRLIWELLCLGDAVTLTAGDGRVWRFKAFANPMWPSDYTEPWLDVEEPQQPVRAVAETQDADAPRELEQPSKSVRPAEPTLNAEPRHDAEQPPAESREPSLASVPPLWPPDPVEGVGLDRNLRVSGTQWLNTLAALVAAPGRVVDLPPTLSANRPTRRHIALLLLRLDLAVVDLGNWTATPTRNTAQLVAAWLANDSDLIFDLLRRWVPLHEWATMRTPPSRPRQTLGSARALAGLLGQGMSLEGVWWPGGRRPTVAALREAVLTAASERKNRTITVYTLLVDVFLRKMGVAPARIVRAWQALWAAGVFDGFEPREGGSSSNRHFQEVAVFTPDGWTTTRIDIESCAGVRDLVLRRPG